MKHLNDFLPKGNIDNPSRRIVTLRRFSLRIAIGRNAAIIFCFILLYIFNAPKFEATIKILGKIFEIFNH